MSFAVQKKSPVCFLRSSHQKSALSLSDQAKKMYQQAAALHALSQAVSCQPARAGCAAVCMSVGVFEVLSGNYVSGAIATGTAAVEISHFFRGSVSSDLQRAFKDIDADVEIIEELQEANAFSYQTIKQQLDVAADGVKRLQEQLDSVAQLHGEGLCGFEEKRQEVASLNQKAIQAYEKANVLFQKAQQKMLFSQDGYQKCKQAFEKIQYLVAHPDEIGGAQSAAEQLVQVAEQAAVSCDEGKSSLDESNELMKEAFEQLQAAHELKDKANRSADRLIANAQTSLHHLVEKNALIRTCGEAVRAAERELAKVQKRHHQIMQLIEVLKKDIRTARELAESRWTTTELVSGVGAAACFAFANPFSAVVVGGAAAYAVRQRSSLFSVASQIYRWAVGVAEPVKKPMEESECLRMEFSETSSGYWGYFIEQRPSATVGTVHIHLGGGDIHSVPFDLRREDAIAKLDVLEFLQMMAKRIMEGNLNPQRCLAILDELNSQEKKLLKKHSELDCVIDLLKERCLDCTDCEPKNNLQPSLKH